MGDSSSLLPLAKVHSLGRESCLENRTQPELSVTVIAFDQGGLSGDVISTLSPQA